MRGRGLTCIACSAVLAACVAAPAQADTTISAATLDVSPTVGDVRPDAGAAGGQALELFADGAATGHFETTESEVHFGFRARGTPCNGNPALTVTLDGRRKFAFTIGSSTYGERGGDLYLAPGVHTLSIAFTNDYSQPASLFASACDRNAIVDTLTLYQRPFDPASFAGAPLSPDAPIDPDSARFVGELGRLLDYVYPGIGRMPVSTSTTSYSVPVYTVPAGQPRVKVAVSGDGAATLQPPMDSVPLPANAMPARGSDSELVVWQPSSGHLWEFWGLGKDLFGQWHTGWGGYIADVHSFPAHFGGPWPATRWGTSASGIELLAGLQRIDELRAGVIDHAVSVHLPAIDISGHRWPAQRQDPDPSQLDGIIREGMRFRLPPTLDIDALGLSPYATIVAKAVQRYGMVVTDKSRNCICFQAEDPSQYVTDPYTGPNGIFGGEQPDFSGFPWSDLQLLAVPDGAQ